MRKLNFLLLLSFFAFTTVGCDDSDDQKAVPVAPILKDIVMPAESNTIPGTAITIEGKGFDNGDILYCTSVSGEADFMPEISWVSDYGIGIVVPETAAGSYEVTVERAGLISPPLSSYLKVAYVIVIDGLSLPAGNVTRGATLTVTGEGFETGDQAVFTSDAYPANTSVTTATTLGSGAIDIVIPDKCYGVNVLTVKRGTRQIRIGTVNVAVAVGDELGGGVVYYTSDEGIHGLIAKRANIGTATEQWGPTSEHGGTKKEIYTGKENTRLCVAKMVEFHQKFDTWPSTKLSAAEKCAAESEVVDGVTYADWFLPSQQELVELFKVKAMLATKGATVGANNYWSSTEGDTDSNAPIWSAYYVNFYEETTVVTAIADKEGWQLGIRPIRQF